jgi:hypothetical protein
MSIKVYKSSEHPPPKDGTDILAFFLDEEGVTEVFCFWLKNKWMFYPVSNPTTRGFDVLSWAMKQKYDIKNIDDPAFWIDVNGYNDFCIKNGRRLFTVSTKILEAIKNKHKKCSEI